MIEPLDNALPGAYTTGIYLEGLSESEFQQRVKAILARPAFSGLPFRIFWGVINYERDRGVTWKEYYSQLYEKIGQRILDEQEAAGLAREKIQYKVCRCDVENTHIYVYLLPAEYQRQANTDTLDGLQIPYDRLFLKILRLLLWGKMLHDGLHGYKLTPTCYQSKILLDTVLDDDPKLKHPRLHALDVQLTWKKPNLLNFFLVNKIMEVNPDISSSSALQIVSVGSSARFRFIRFLDGRYHKRHYLLFPPKLQEGETPLLRHHAWNNGEHTVATRMCDIRRTVNTWQHLIARKLLELLTQCGFKVKQFIFRPQWQQNHFITQMPEEKKQPLIVIDNLGDGQPDLKDWAIQTIRESGYWSKVSVQQPPHYPELSSFAQGTAYLVLNQCKQDSGSMKVVVRNKVDKEEELSAKDTLELIRYKEADRLLSTDYYSGLKVQLLAQIEKDIPCPIIQGLDFPSLGPEKQAQLQIKSFKESLVHKLGKIRTELSVKRALHQSGQMTQLGLATNRERKQADNNQQRYGALMEGSVFAMYGRTKRASDQNNLPEFRRVALCCLHAVNNNIHIKKKQVLSSKLKLMDALGEAQAATEIIWSLPDRSGILIDSASKRMLIYYTDNTVPMLTGREGVDIPEQVRREGSLTRSAEPDVNLFPYLNNNMPAAGNQPNQREHLYIMHLDREPENGMECLIFVSGKQSLKNMDKQRRVYRLLVIDFKGCPCNPMEQALTDAFLHSFDRELLNENDSARSSLFIKFPRALMEN
ncbi:hypothetical protein [Endozoicomonas sp. Mp262]|uniref:hypothetical protein n=1 Tax=Endozoicomonas sp. Mp262 TaxID=2919499 RepID=UPI0021D80DEF